MHNSGVPMQKKMPWSAMFLYVNALVAHLVHMWGSQRVHDVR